MSSEPAGGLTHLGSVDQVNHRIVLTAALFREMVTYMKADELITGYTTAYPDDGAEGDYLVEVYAANWGALATMLDHLREALNADESLQPKERLDRMVKLGAKSDAGIMAMVHGLVESDGTFERLGKDEVREATLFGVVRPPAQTQIADFKGRGFTQ